MDIQMPGMDGVESMKKIRTLSDDYLKTSVIALTAYALPHERQTFLNQGFQTLITKPIDEAKLKETIDHFLPSPPVTVSPADQHINPAVESTEPQTSPNLAAAWSSPENLQATTSRSIETRSHTTEPPTKPSHERSLVHPKLIIDREEGTRLCNGNAELADTFLKKFLDALPEEKRKIVSLHEKQELELLEECIHKLHGACHYCGVPRLRNAVKNAEHALKTYDRDADKHILNLLNDINLVLQERDDLLT